MARVILFNHEIASWNNFKKNTILESIERKLESLFYFASWIYFFKSKNNNMDNLNLDKFILLLKMIAIIVLGKLILCFIVANYFIFAGICVAAYILINEFTGFVDDIVESCSLRFKTLFLFWRARWYIFCFKINFKKSSWLSSSWKLISALPRAYYWIENKYILNKLLSKSFTKQEKANKWLAKKRRLS